MSGITKILTRTPSELGSIKTNKSPIIEENKQLPAEQWNTAADAIIEIQTAIGETANPAAGTITEILSDHEERIDELEQNGGGGGSSDRIESASGDAFAEATDDFLGMGTSAVLSRTNHADGSAIAYTAILPGEGGPSHPVLMSNVAVTNANETQAAGIGAQYDPITEVFRLQATGAPLQVEEPIESSHAATKGYVDSQAGGGGTPGHVICQAVEGDPPLLPMPQRANLAFISTGVEEVTVQDFEELDATVVLIPEGSGGGGGGPINQLYDEVNTPSGPAFSSAYVGASYDEGTSEESLWFQVDLRDTDNNITEARLTRGTQGKHLIIDLDGSDPNSPVLEVVDHPTFGDKEFRLQNAPTLIETPVKPMHAATKDYVDARPGAEEWSEHAATEDVDLDGHKLTGLAAPTDDDDAATKDYVDAHSHLPESGTHWGRWAGAEYNLPNAEPFGNPLTGLAYDRLKAGDTAVLVNGTEVTYHWCLSPGGEGASPSAQWRPLSPLWHTTPLGNPPVYDYLRIRSATNYSDGATRRQEVANWQYVTGNGNAHGKRFTNLADPVDDQDAATKGYVDARLPIVEWWAPTWTPVANVDSVVNVECSYTRSYRAAGGSLVTLEGTITVTPDAAGQCAVQVNLPVARVGSGLLAGTAMAMEVTPPGHVVAVASVGSTTLTLGFIAEGADPYLVGFRASYRAA